MMGFLCCSDGGVWLPHGCSRGQVQGSPGNLTYVVHLPCTFTLAAAVVQHPPIRA